MLYSLKHLLMLFPILICAYPFRSLIYTLEDPITYGFAISAMLPYIVFYILWVRFRNIEPYFQTGIVLIMAILTFYFYSPHDGFLLFFLIAFQLCIFCILLPIYLWLKKRNIGV